eukprot:m.1438067 g.1438067  ORF g.1438067 m.1438067 type:complete len:83 (+) comp25088_c0_seq57:3032-3280(+)
MVLVHDSGAIPVSHFQLPRHRLTSMVIHNEAVDAGGDGQDIQVVTMTITTKRKKNRHQRFSSVTWDGQPEGNEIMCRMQSDM